MFGDRGHAFFVTTRVVDGRNLMIRNYTQIKTPFKINADELHMTFRDKSKRDLDAYCKWYVDSIPERIRILEQAVQSTLGFESWRADCSPSSLKKLDEWFAKVFTLRERTKEEYRQLWGDGPDLNELAGVGTENRTLTDETVSISIDVGMYLSQVFLRNIPKLRWEFLTKRKSRNVQYGQPILAGFRHKLALGPTEMAIGQAFKFSRNNFKRGLKDIYDIWSKMVE